VVQCPYLALQLLYPSATHATLNDRRCFPTPLADIVARDTHLSRLGERDHIPTYKHESGPRSTPRSIYLMYDPEDPYVKHNQPVGSQVKTQTWNMVKYAIFCRQNLLGPIVALRALSG